MIPSNSCAKPEVEIKAEEFGWAVLLVLAYVLFWLPTIQAHPALSIGDSGRDLYAYWMTLQGQWPGRDFFYQYSPLMPFYYAFWFLVGGAHLISMRIALGILLLTCGLLTFKTLRMLVSPPVAFLASLGFLSLDIIHTYNHVGGLLLLLAALFSLWKFFAGRRIAWVYFGALAIAGITAVKINMGFSMLMAFLGSLWLDHFLSKRHFVWLTLVFGGLVLISYVPLYWGLPASWLAQGLGGLSWHYSLWGKLVHIPMRFLVWERWRLWWAGAFLAFAVLGFLGLKKKGMTETERKFLPRVLGSLVIFGLMSTADYFMMEGYFHRLSFWFFPVMVLSFGLFAEWASRILPRPLKIVLWCLTFLLVSWVPFHKAKEALAWRIPERYLDFPQGKVYLGGDFGDVETIKNGTRFLIENTKPEDEILAVPYAALYCFLSGRRHAVRELAFYQTVRINETQEQEIIRKLDAKKTPMVLVANNLRLREPGVGRFGETHCLRLAKYIDDHYEEAGRWGPWEMDPPERLAVRILRRKTNSGRAGP